MAKGYKAFNKGLVCRGHQFEVGKTYEIDGHVELCDRGYHYCDNPLDVLYYYDLTTSEFAEVEAIAVKQDKHKSVTNKITISAKLELPAFIKAAFDFLWERNDPSKATDSYSQLASSGYYSQLASSGYYSQLASSGDYSQLASSGYYSQLASSGYNSKLASSGYYSQLASSGDNSQLASSGDNSQLASSGDNSKLASSGDNSQLASSGYNSKLDVTGNKCVAVNIGYRGQIKASLGTWITLAEYDNDGVVVHVKTAKVDGAKIKADTWYRLVNKKFKEVQ